MIFSELFTHFFVGISVGLLFVLLYAWYKKRRPVFRFGGDSPLSIGEKRKWL